MKTIQDLIAVIEEEKEAAYKEGKYEFRAGLCWAVDRVSELIPLVPQCPHCGSQRLSCVNGCVWNIAPEGGRDA